MKQGTWNNLQSNIIMAILDAQVKMQWEEYSCSYPDRTEHSLPGMGSGVYPFRRQGRIAEGRCILPISSEPKGLCQWWIIGQKSCMFLQVT
jgi:hypothetical protein